MSSVLGIETSCDESAAAVYDSDRGLLASVVYSQAELHSLYGGIVPELASRKHLETLLPVVESSLKQAGKSLAQLDAVAVTQGPGLIGSLLTGISLAKSLAWCHKLPLIGVDHLLGHIYSGFLSKTTPTFPFVALLVSGGHTSLYAVESFSKRRLLGRTLDDAVGEAFDKVAKSLGLGYPGGAAIEGAAKQGRPDKVKLPLPFPGRKNLNFSFSGIKTAVVQSLKQGGYSDKQPPAQEMADLCFTFQQAVIQVLRNKALAAMEQNGISQLVLCGGVAANGALRSDLTERCLARGYTLHVPEIKFCTDNAAMIAFLGQRLFDEGHISPLTLGAYARSEENRR